MVRSVKRLEMVVAIFGVIISAGATFVASEVLGILFLILTLQVELILRTTRTYTEWEKWEPTIAAMREGSADWVQSTVKMVDAMAQLGRASDDRAILVNFSAMRIRETADYVVKCNGGSISAERSDIDLMFEMASRARSTIEAITSFRDITWWKNSEYGKKFILAQKLALKENPALIISRVMIIEGSSPTDEEIEVMKSLSRPRMSVSYVALSTAQSCNLDVNLTIIDGRFCHVDVNEGGRSSHRYTVNPTEIETARGRFKGLKMHVATFDPA